MSGAVVSGRNETVRFSIYTVVVLQVLPTHATRGNRVAHGVDFKTVGLELLGFSYVICK